MFRRKIEGVMLAWNDYNVGSLTCIYVCTKPRN